MGIKKKTFGRILEEVREFKERAAVSEALANYLRTRYLPRDSVKTVPQIPCDGSPVSEATLDAMAAELESSAKEMRTLAESRLKEEIP
jgi:hypothetical protein